MASTQQHGTPLHLLAVVLSTMMVALSLFLLDGFVKAGVAAVFAITAVVFATIMLKRAERSDT